MPKQKFLLLLERLREKTIRLKGFLFSKFEKRKKETSSGTERKMRWFLPWISPSSKQRIHFWINVGIGILIAMIFHFMETKDWGENATNIGFDIMVRHEKKLAHENRYGNSESSLFFIDITHEDYKRWGEYEITPRRNIAQLIDFAVQSKARVVVLDILLEKEDCCHPDGDNDLKTILANVLKDNPSAKIVVPVRIDSEGTIRTTIIDHLIKQDANLVWDGKKREPTFYTAVPAVSATPNDLKVRYWSVYQRGRSINGAEEIVWSVPMVACALYSNGNIRDLEKIEKSLLSKKSNKTVHAKDEKPLMVTFGLPSKPIKIPVEGYSFFDELYAQRIRYKIPQALKEGFVASKEGTNNILLTADQILAPSAQAKVNLKNRVVVIGNSSPESGDIHPTVIGRIPGMYILGNSINTILEGLQPEKPRKLVNLTVEAIVIYFAACLFLYFSSYLAHILTSLVMMAVMVPLTWWCFLEFGVYYNFILPILGMGLHETATSIEEIIQNRGLNKIH